MGFIRYCEHCNETKANTSIASLFFLKYSKETVDNFFRGYIYGIQEEYWIANTKCPFCKNETLVTNITNEEIEIIFITSNGNRQLLDEMIELKQKDIIEYELKMAQFRNQAEQKNIIDSKKSDDNTPKCPTCGSTNIKKISTTAKMTNTMLFGIFGNKRKKQFYCESCGYEW